MAERELPSANKDEKMKVVYKIYHSCLAKIPESGYGHVTPMRTPDFDTEMEAEKYLIDKTSKHVDNGEYPDWGKNWHAYYFIQKTYIQE